MDSGLPRQRSKEKAHSLNYISQPELKNDNQDDSKRPTRLKPGLQHINKDLPQQRKESQNLWAVERIVDVKRDLKTRKTKYLIKWEGWPSRCNTWEPAENLGDSIEEIPYISTISEPTVSHSEKESKVRCKDSSNQSLKRSQKLWEIEDIIDEKVNDDGELLYLIKWKNWAKKHNTWEPRSNLHTNDISALKIRLAAEKAGRKLRRTGKSKNVVRSICTKNMLVREVSSTATTPESEVRESSDNSASTAEKFFAKIDSANNFAPAEKSKKCRTSTPTHIGTPSRNDEYPENDIKLMEAPSMETKEVRKQYTCRTNEEDSQTTDPPELPAQQLRATEAASS